MEAISKRDEKKKEKEKKVEEKKKAKPAPPQVVKGQANRPSQQVVQARQGVGKAQQKPSMVYPTQKGGKHQMQPQPFKGTIQKNMPLPQKQVPPQMQGKTQFIEWNFRVNENNVMPIIDRAMMVTESMHMLLTSLREDIQKAGTGSATSQRSVTKLDASNKLKRALGAFNKSFFDLSLFSQKTSGPK